MGRGSSSGSVRDHYKKKGQAGRGEGTKRRKLTKSSAEKRAETNRKSREANPSNG